ncbi:hypothetical protein Zmor_027498 [Zophobas morio]|uniref:Cytochrome P450 n=1 Tax=Zophobas morio TaxID=2755281 RepID=A0AA38HNJ7_9CUCU|nr:hypothetical protein Zmor_027498 [Zophobas morio]
MTYKKKQNFWKKMGVPFIKPPFFVGSMEMMSSKSLAEKLQTIYHTYPDARCHGVNQFSSPILVIKDPDLIKQVTVKDFDHFVNHRSMAILDNDPFWSKNLFASRDERWRNLRYTLSPSFTSSKMKIMFSLIDECAQQFVDYFKKQDEEVVELEVKDALSRYTTDVIATTAFGVRCNSLQDKKNDFYLMGEDASNIGGLRLLKFVFYEISPLLCKLLQVRLIPTNVTNYFSKIIEDTVRTRRDKNIVRPDMIQLLMEAQNNDANNQNKREITLDDINSQAFIFFLAGFETVSTFLTFSLYELALNRDVQDRLRQELDSVKETITYETLLGLKYLDMVVCESLRKWPPAIVTDRQVTKNFTIKPEKPGEKEILLEKGLTCWIPIIGLHTDAKFYPNPEKFDPERFSEENKHKINSSAYMPFGTGPRNCIGSRFAILESKLIIFYILRNFEVVQIEKTQVPIVLDKKKINLAAQGGVWLGLKKIK